jgi:copper chaperone CopZ
MRSKLRRHYLSRMITRARIDGMTCQHCVRAVFTGLTAVEGITRADVRIGAVEVEHDGRVTADQLRSAIAAAGYEIVASEENRRRLPVA